MSEEQGHFTLNDFELAVKEAMKQQPNIDPMASKFLISLGDPQNGLFLRPVAIAAGGKTVKDNVLVDPDIIFIVKPDESVLMDMIAKIGEENGPEK